MGLLRWAETLGRILDPRAPTYLALLLAASVYYSTHTALGQETINVKSVLLSISEKVEVASGEAGLLETVLAKEGKIVERGEMLGQIDDDDVALDRQRADIELSIAKAEAENDIQVRVAEKTLAVAQAELRRGLDLKSQFRDSISQSEIDRLRLVAERSTLELEQAQHRSRIVHLTLGLKQTQIDAAELALRRRKISAPFPGIVDKVEHRTGEWVEAGDVVCRVVRIDRLRVEGYVEAAALRSSLQGRPVTVLIDLPGAPQSTFAGEVVFVDPVVDPVNAQARVWAEIDNPQQRLRPGLKGSMTILPPRANAPSP